MGKTAPTGARIRGTYEKVPGVSVVTFFGESWDHSGRTEVCWDASETQSVMGVPIFTDECGENWLEHHLIPDEAEPLTPDTIDQLRRELRYGDFVEAHRAVFATLSGMTEAGDPVPNEALSHAEHQLGTAGQLYEQQYRFSKKLIEMDLEAQKVSKP